MEKIIKRIESQMVKNKITRYRIMRDTGLSWLQLKNLLACKNVHAITLFKVLKVVGIKNIKI
jgi:hypothetical protein